MNNKYINDILKLKQEKNAVILCHYYQTGDIQDIADFLGDSLALAQAAKNTNADIILFAGVKFMADTAKILNPDKKVLLPDINAGCSLADSCPENKFKEFLKLYPNHTVISYINTSTEIKALSDVLCTSSNAVKIVESFNKEEKLIFAPDKNLGNYINSLTGRNMVLWNGACHVHERFSIDKILKLKIEYPNSKFIAHPECTKPILILADYIGSTTALLDFTKKDKSNSYIVATESGIIHQMKLANPMKDFIPAPPSDNSCACNDCSFMKLITLEKIFNSLKNEEPEIKIQEELRLRALKPLIRMLELS
mgnify:CR=1 FL=1